MNGRKSLRCFLYSLPQPKVVLRLFFFYPFSIVLLVHLPLSHTHKHVLHKPPFCSQMSWEREANVPFHLKEHTNTHRQWSVSGQGSVPVQECGDDKLWRCQGRDPCCYSQTPKTLHPTSNSSLAFYPPFFSLLLLCRFLSMSPHLTSTSVPDYDVQSSVMFQPLHKTHFCFISLSLFFLHCTNSLAQYQITGLPDVSNISGQDVFEFKLME